MATKALPDLIDQYLARTGMNPTAFGKQAMGDPTFVFDLRKGRRCWPETEAKVRDFIRANAPSEAA